ncbi:HvfC/BufC N-terminal domain-containing protein [Adhaeribacter soli]|uniref:DUF2063 domain-containing protein n=1 Tax=Adhaeribacter soli TaxID=2607655 RepID=A0A5N1IXB5_9BACT|nr:DNA-binding domain-containing protein [Adhaeribacter soli]KAA9338980.1 DUF2063 domain-containing protein [Adhaeribacter soli]
MPELNTLQKWLTSIIIRPGKLQDKVRMADRHYALNHAALVDASPNLSSEDKIGIYARGYVLRLMECLEAEFPALQHLLGNELFESFARAYLVQLPPNSTDLYDLGYKFSAFLQASQKKLSKAEATLYALPVELAKYERALAEVSRLPGLEGKSKETGSFGFLGLLNTNFQTAPCLKLLQLQFPLIDYVNEFQLGVNIPAPEPKESFALICRKNYAITLQYLEDWQWHFLQSLQNTNNYQAAIQHCCNQLNIEKETLMAELFLWLPMAQDMGYVFQVQSDL